jgi:hypothetical protein
MARYAILAQLSQAKAIATREIPNARYLVTNPI